MRSLLCAALTVPILLAACGRPLTESEMALLAPIHGETLDTGPVRLAANPLVGLVPLNYPVRPRTTCRERIAPPVEGPIVEGRAGGVVLFETLFLNPDVDRPNFALEPLNLGAAMFLVHEMTHVWQWQNSGLTGYTPWRVAAEHVRSVDPYLYDPADPREFLDFGYEQQAILVEEYLCCAVLDPEGVRTVQLYDLLSDVMPVARPPAFERAVLLPWDGVQLEGICAAPE
ncbi:MAG: hypothetical protein AAF919_02575 [Pseudomonadota bacterium]